MQADIRAGKRDIDPMKAYHHNKVIANLFRKARTRAWAKMMTISEVQTLVQKQKELERQQRLKLKKTQEYQPLLQMSK